MESAQYNKETLKILIKNKKDLEEAEKRILFAMNIDFQQREVTIPFVTQKLFEISNTILLLTEQIEKCREAMKKS